MQGDGRAGSPGHPPKGSGTPGAAAGGVTRSRWRVRRSVALRTSPGRLGQRGPGFDQQISAGQRPFPSCGCPAQNSVLRSHRRRRTSTAAHQRRSAPCLAQASASPGAQVGALPLPGAGPETAETGLHRFSASVRAVVRHAPCASRSPSTVWRWLCSMCRRRCPCAGAAIPPARRNRTTSVRPTGSRQPGCDHLPRGIVGL